MKKYLFTEEEKKNVATAVQELEKESCGEIVPFFARRSDEYSEVSWQLACLLGLLGLGTTVLMSYSWKLPSISYFELALGILFLMVIGYVLPECFPLIKRAMASPKKQSEMVFLRAKEAFVNEKVYNTKEHVGILIYISRLEHMVVVLGDEAINQKVRQQDWEEVIALTVSGLKHKKIGDGLVNAINHCKMLLLEHGFTRKDSDTNELSDNLRIKD